MKAKTLLKKEATEQKFIVLTEEIERVVKEGYTRGETEVFVNLTSKDYDLMELSVLQAGFQVEKVVEDRYGSTYTQMKITL